MALEMRGKPLSDALRQWCAEQVREMKETTGRIPGLAILQVGNDPASEAYMRQKVKACDAAGIRSFPVSLPADASFESAAKQVEEWNNNPDIEGVFLEHPLPSGWEHDLRLRIHAVKDVEGLHQENLGKLYLGDTRGPWPCTAEAVIRLLEWYGFDHLNGKRAVVVGRSISVGRAAALLLLHRNATVTVAHSRSHGLDEELARADIVVAAVGRPGIVRSDMLAEDVVVLDVGTNVQADGSLVGDVMWDTYRCKAFTPVPGGIGPVTVGLLLRNLVLAAWRMQGVEVEMPSMKKLRESSKAP